MWNTNQSRSMNIMSLLLVTYKKKKSKKENHNSDPFFFYPSMSNGETRSVQKQNKKYVYFELLI